MHRDPIATAALIALGLFAAALVLTLAGIVAGELLVRRRSRQAAQVEAQAAADAYQRGAVVVLDGRDRR